MAYNPLSTISNAHSFEDEQSITVTFAAATAATYALPAEWYNVASALQIVILYGAGGGMYFVGNPAAKATTPVQFSQTADPGTATADQALLSIVAGATPAATNTAHNLTLLKDTDDGALSLGVTATAAAAAMTVMVRRWAPAVTA
jgi:hypothetical protein